MTASQDAALAVADLALPVVCAGCGVGGEPWCSQCHARLLGCCARVRPERVGPPMHWVEARWAASYTAPVPGLVQAWKEEGRLDVTPVLAALAAVPVAEAMRRARGQGARGPVLFVPAPSRPSSNRKRGVVVMTRLAEAVVRLLRARPQRSGPYAVDRLQVAPVLVHRRRVADQAGLGQEARVSNLAGALGVRDGARHPRVQGRACIVLDDVITTGATAVECARVLREAGATGVSIAAVARTPKTGRGVGHVHLPSGSPSV